MKQISLQMLEAEKEDIMGYDQQEVWLTWL